MKNRLIILIVAVFLIVGGLLIYKLIIKDNTSLYSEQSSYSGYLDYHIIHYYTNLYVYDIETKYSELHIKKSEIVECVTVPCNPMMINSFTIEYQQEYIDLFKRIIDEKKEKEITITKKDLSQGEQGIMHKIIKSNPYYYSIKGYYLDKDDNNEDILIVSMGMQSTGGHSISIEKVDTSDSDILKVYVKESNPEGSAATVITCPTTSMVLKNIPKEIIVQEINNNDNYRRIYDE